jgi:predicted dehydrogenase
MERQMSDQVGFLNMAGGRAPTDLPTVGIGLLGYAFMGKAHTNAYKTLPYMIYPPAAVPRLVAIAGRNQDALQAAAARYGYERTYADYHALVQDPDVQLFDNAGPNNEHAPASIAAAQAGKHVLCEKPLARNAAEARAMLDAVQAAGVKHMVSFNYRFVPAVRLAYELIQEGALGEIYHFRAHYLQEWLADPALPFIWRASRAAAGSGALGDLGAHIIDLARFLVGEPAAVLGLTRTFVKERPIPGGGTGLVDVDDAFAALVEFAGGAAGTLEASRFAKGHKNDQVFEINGSKGTLRFHLERLNELEVYWEDGRKETRGFTNVSVTESFHPFYAHWWPHGHVIGWEHTFVHEVAHLIDAMVNNKDVAPLGATFEDGYRNAVIADAILESAAEGRRVAIRY